MHRDLDAGKMWKFKALGPGRRENLCLNKSDPKLQPSSSLMTTWPSPFYAVPSFEKCIDTDDGGLEAEKKGCKVRGGIGEPKN